MKAVFFDLDGTITDTEKIYQKHWVNTIRAFGFPDFPDDGALDLRSINSIDGNALMKGRLGEKFDYDAIHDLMKKATGWMLREVGKRDEGILTDFLDRHCLQMPRTMLRYAIEKLTTEQRVHYMRRPL